MRLTGGWAAVLLGLGGCAPGAPPHPAAPPALNRAESLYAVVRTLKDRLDIATFRARSESITVLHPRHSRRAELAHS
jgi:hypothetical protein